MTSFRLRISALLTVALVSCCSTIATTNQNAAYEWEDTKLKVASTSASTNFLGFNRSIALFRSSNPQLERTFGLEFIEGNATSVIDETSTIHITGNLDTNVFLPAQGNVNWTNIVDVINIRIH